VRSIDIKYMLLQNIHE